MENENRAPKLVQLTVKVNQTTLDKWRDNLQEGMFPTAGQFMELLINQYEENYSKPVRVNKENEEKIRQLQERIDTLLLENDQLKEQLSVRMTRKFAGKKARVAHLHFLYFYGYSQPLALRPPGGTPKGNRTPYYQN